MLTFKTNFSIVKRWKRLWTLEPDRNVVSPTESTAWGMRTIGNTLEQTSWTSKYGKVESWMKSRLVRRLHVTHEKRNLRKRSITFVLHLPYPSVWPCWFRYFSCILYRYLVYWSFLCSWMYVWSQWIYLTASVWIMLERWLLQEVCFFSYLRGIHFYFCFLFLFSSSSWLTPVHEKDLVLCLLLDVTMQKF